MQTAFKARARRGQPAPDSWIEPVAASMVVRCAANGNLVPNLRQPIAPPDAHGIYRVTAPAYGARRAARRPRLTKGIGISQRHSFLLVGGSGFLGRQLARRLVASGHRVAISTRRPDDRPSLPGNVSIIGHSEVDENLSSFDAVVVLTVINNDVSAPPEQFQAVNVDYPVSLARKLARRPRSVLVAFGSTHAAELRRIELYSTSQKQLQEALGQIEGLVTRLFIIPPAYGETFVRKLPLVDRLPGFLRRMAITLIGALKPIVDVDRIAAQLASELAPETRQPGLVVRLVADDQSANPVYRAVTRGCDLILALAVLMAFSWLMILIVLLIRMETHGPALFRQERVGRNGTQFTCYKFRTMRTGAPHVGTHEISPDVITSVGRRLRKWKLDELPQVFNVLRNQMSWVGPRPNLPVQIELTEERRKRGVLAVKPGITGLAQVRGIDMSDAVQLAKTDAEFVFLRSIPLYFQLLAQTFLGRGQGDRVRSAAPAEAGPGAQR